METGPSGSRFHIVASREKLSEKAGFKISCSDCSFCTYDMKPENRSIAINHDTCDTGRKCIQVCPAGIFVQEKKEPIGVAHPENCIVCGHCVSLPDRFAQAQRFSAGNYPSHRLFPDAVARTGDAAHQIPAIQPRPEFQSGTPGKTGKNHRGRPIRTHRIRPAAGFLYRHRRSRNSGKSATSPSAYSMGLPEN